MEGSSPDGRTGCALPTPRAPCCWMRPMPSVFWPRRRGLGHGLNGVSLLCGTLARPLPAAERFGLRRLAGGRAAANQRRLSLHHSPGATPRRGRRSLAAIASAEGDQRRQQLNQHAQLARFPGQCWLAAPSRRWPDRGGEAGGRRAGLDAAAALEEQGCWWWPSARPPFRKGRRCCASACGRMPQDAEPGTGNA